MARIIVDSRESKSGIADHLKRGGAEVVIEEMESGDYQITEEIGIERKASNDFVISIMDGRFVPQIKLLKATFKEPYVLIEGDPFDTRSNIDENAVIGALSYISVIEGIKLLYTNSPRQSAAMMLTLQRHALEGLGYVPPLRAGKPKERSSQAKYLVEGLPGVGAAGADKLLAHFGHPRAIFTATQEELVKVPGLGPKTAVSIREVLDWSRK